MGYFFPVALALATLKVTLSLRHSAKLSFSDRLFGDRLIDVVVLTFLPNFIQITVLKFWERLIDLAVSFISSRNYPNCSSQIGFGDRLIDFAVSINFS